MNLERNRRIEVEIGHSGERLLLLRCNTKGRRTRRNHDDAEGENGKTKMRIRFLLFFYLKKKKEKRKVVSKLPV